MQLQITILILKTNNLIMQIAIKIIKNFKKIENILFLSIDRNYNYKINKINNKKNNSNLKKKKINKSKFDIINAIC